MENNKSPSLLAWLRRMLFGRQTRRPARAVASAPRAAMRTAAHPKKHRKHAHAAHRGAVHPKKRFASAKVKHAKRHAKQHGASDESADHRAIPAPENDATDASMRDEIVQAPTPPKEAPIEQGALAALLQEEGWMQKAKAKPVETVYEKPSIWHMTMGDLARTYMPTFFRFKKRATPSIGPVPKNADKTTLLSAASTEEQATDAMQQSTDAEAAREVQLAEQDQAPASAKDAKGKKRKARGRKESDVSQNLPPPPPVSAPTVPSPTPPALLSVHTSLQTGTGLKAFVAAVKNLGLGHERMLFIQSLSTMLDAGLPLLDSLKTLVAESRSRRMKKVVGTIVTDIENGKPFWRAMEDQRLFSPHALALVRIGEETGSLAKNMQYLAVQEDKDHQLKQKVRMAMFYPAIVCVLMFGIVMGLGMFILPQLVGVLYSLNVELPLVTRMVIWFSETMSQHGMAILPSSVGAILLLVIVMKFTPLRIVGQTVIFLIPGIGRLAREATIARFGVILGGLLRAGVPVVEALQSLVNVTSIVSYRRFYRKLLEHVNTGDSFATSFAAIRGSTRVLPASVQQLIMSGEKSGALAEMMLKIAEIYDRKAGETAQKLPVILEPMLLLIIGALVGTIAFAIIVPIYGIVGSVGR